MSANQHKHWICGLFYLLGLIIIPIPSFIEQIVPI